MDCAELYDGPQHSFGHRELRVQPAGRGDFGVARRGVSGLSRHLPRLVHHPFGRKPRSRELGSRDIQPRTNLSADVGAWAGDSVGWRDGGHCGPGKNVARFYSHIAKG